MSRIVFLSCHLTGTGHLIRTLALACRARAAGHTVSVITGGRPLAHIDTRDVDVVQLPPVGVRDFEFTILRMPDGSLVTEAYMADRLAALKQHLAGVRPDALITELFPLGRRVLAEEFMSAIAIARKINPDVVVLSSVRDIPEPKPRRLTEAATRLLKHYDGVLVHGDADFLPLATTWPLPDDVAPLIQHVGYIGSVRTGKPEPRTDEVLVAVGGGVLGRRLLQVSAKAAATSPLPWRLLVGGADAATVARDMTDQNGADNLTIEPNRADYRERLARAGCSISLCGYNTAVELAACTTPAILVPSEEAGETEQMIRARRLAEHPGFSLMQMEMLSPGPLANAAEALVAGPPRSPVPLKADNGTEAVRTIERIIAAKT